MIVGQKVVCIDDKFSLGIKQLYVALPVAGQVYVIRNVVMGITIQDPKGEKGCEVCLYLVGLNNPRSSVHPYPERGFNAERFRPLDELKNKGTARKSDEDEVYADAVSGSDKFLSEDGTFQATPEYEPPSYTPD